MIDDDVEEEQNNADASILRAHGGCPHRDFKWGCCSAALMSSCTRLLCTNEYSCSMGRCCFLIIFRVTFKVVNVPPFSPLAVMAAVSSRMLARLICSDKRLFLFIPNKLGGKKGEGRWG